MARSKTLDLIDIIDPEDMAYLITNFWFNWDQARNVRISQWNEVDRYVYATDTTTTTNSQNDWSNKTTIPKLCQIRDNLIANYEAAMFPKRKWLDWSAASKEDNDMDKQTKIKNYMLWNVESPFFKEEMKKLIRDYVDRGDCFVGVEWVDKTTDESGVVKPGFTGARPVRINPLDIVFNPTSTSFAESPKIIRSLMSIGEAKKTLDALSKTEEEKIIAQQVFDQCMKNRMMISNGSKHGPGDFQELEQQYMVNGFGSYVDYLSSEYCELLTFYGDLYDKRANTLYENYMIVVIDRCKVAYKAPHAYPLGEIPIWHAGWRTRTDNLWSMGPLDNLVGMQYRLDHIENLKADLFDLTAFPPIKVQGLVQEFEWGPMEKIYVDSSDGSNVELMQPQTNMVSIDLAIQRYEEMMEEMAGAPKEAMGIRTPGEKTAYEVQRLENAAGRIFQNKVAQFEEAIVEPVLNGMLVYAKEYLTPQTIRFINDDYNTVDFETITKSDLAANGRLKPMAARHFAEKAERVQNLTNFANSPLYQDQAVNVHFSGLKIAKMMETELGIEDWDIVQPYIRLSEQAAAESQANSYQETNMTAIGTPSGLTPDDASASIPS